MASLLLDQASADTTTQDDIAAPLVFSCRKCRTIIGDSYSYVLAEMASGTITLTSASNIQRSADVYTSKSGFDIGSTYFNFDCNSCIAPLGKYYLTTSKELDHMREKFTFNIDSISSYELGKSEHGTMPDPQIDDSSDTVDNSNSGGGNGNEEGNGIAQAAIAVLTDDVLKLQHVVMSLVERISILENRGNSNINSNDTMMNKRKKV